MKLKVIITDKNDQILLIPENDFEKGVFKNLELSLFDISVNKEIERIGAYASTDRQILSINLNRVTDTPPNDKNQ